MSLILYCGDSTVWGVDGAYPVPAENTWVPVNSPVDMRLLPRVANPAPSFIQVPGYTVQNFGVPGCDTLQLLTGNSNQGQPPFADVLAELEPAIVISNCMILDARDYSATAYAGYLNDLADLCATAGARLIFESAHPITVTSGNAHADYIAAQKTVAADLSLDPPIGQYEYMSRYSISQTCPADGVHGNQFCYREKGLFASMYLLKLLTTSTPNRRAACLVSLES